MSMKSGLVLLVVACSSSDKVSAVDSSKSMQSLSIAETAQYCSDLKEYRDKTLSPADVNRSNCASRALMEVVGAGASSDAEARAACQRGLDDCMKEPPPNKPIDCADLASTFECKELTVGDLNACLQEMFSSMKKDTDPCSKVKANDVPSSMGAAETWKSSPSCQAIEMKCGNTAKPKKGRAAQDAVAKMESFSGRMCRCRDKACADKVNEDMAKWGTEMARTAGAARDEKPDPELAKRSADIMTRYTECMTKLMMAGAGAPN